MDINYKIELAMKQSYAGHKLCEENVHKEYSDLASSFKCPVCYFIVEDLTKCKTCDKVFCSSCKDRNLSRACPMCTKHFVASREDRLVRELLDKIKFNCPDCRTVFAYEDRADHLHNVVVTACPFGCQDFEPCHPVQLA